MAGQAKDIESDPNPPEAAQCHVTSSWAGQQQHYFLQFLSLVVQHREDRGKCMNDNEQLLASLYTRIAKKRAESYKGRMLVGPSW